MGEITFSEKTCLPALAAAGNDLAVGDGRGGDDHPVYVLAGEEFVETLAEWDTTPGDLRPAVLCVLIPDGAELRLGMLLGILSS